MDRFKEINDTFGHAAGDRTLEVLTRAADARPAEGQPCVGRLAGDEFALFIEDLRAIAETTAAQAANLARMVLAEVCKAYYVDQQEVFLTASVGIAFCPKDAENVIDLIRNADAAMYSLEAERRQQLRLLLAGDERGGGRAPDAEEQAAPRARARRAGDVSTSRRSTCATAASSAPRRCCAGGCPGTATFRRRSSFRSPRRPT